jgi:hypothetical protein
VSLKSWRSPSRVRALSAWAGCLALLLGGGAARAQDPVSEQPREYDCRLWYCIADSRGQGATYLRGVLSWDQAKGALVFDLEPSQKLFWTPSAHATEKGLPCPLREFGKLHAEVERLQKGRWRIVAADEQPAPEGGGPEDRARIVLGFGRVFHLALAAHSQADMETFDWRTIEAEDSRDFSLSPFSAQRTAPAGPDEYFSYEVTLVRGSGPGVDAAVIQGGPERVRAIFPVVWAGAGSTDPQEKASLAHEAVEKLRGLLETSRDKEHLDDDTIKELLHRFSEWHPGVKVSFSLLEMSPRQKGDSKEDEAFDREKNAPDRGE